MRAIRTAAIACALAFAATASAATPGGLVPKLPDGNGAVVRPATILLSGDGSGGFGGADGIGSGNWGHIRWRSWTAARAAGLGGIWESACPNCSGSLSKWYFWPGTVTATKPKHGIFTVLTVTSNWPKERRQVYTLHGSGPYASWG